MPEAAVLLRDHDPEEAELGHLVPQRHRDLAALRVELVGDGQHLLHRELAGEVAEGEAFLGEIGAGHCVSRRAMRLVRWKSITSSSPLNPSVCQVTIP